MNSRLDCLFEVSERDGRRKSERERGRVRKRGRGREKQVKEWMRRKRMPTEEVAAVVSHSQFTSREEKGYNYSILCLILIIFSSPSFSSSLPSSSFSIILIFLYHHHPFCGSWLSTTSLLPFPLNTVVIEFSGKKRLIVLLVSGLHPHPFSASSSSLSILIIRSENEEGERGRRFDLSLAESLPLSFSLSLFPVFSLSFSLKLNFQNLP